MNQFLDHTQPTDSSATLEDLYSSGKFSAFLNAFNAQYPHTNQCNDLGLINLVIRAKSLLGLTREAKALLWRFWRKHNQPQELIELYLSVLKNQGSHWQGLKEAKRLCEKIENPKTLSRIYSYQCEVLSLFRDFKGAEEALKTAKTLTDDNWNDVTQAYLALDNDAPDEAFNIVERVLSSDPTNYSAIQLKAHLHHLNGDVDSAAAMLAPSLDPNNKDAIESVYLAVKQAYYLIELEQYQNAHQMVELAKSWLPNPPAYWTRWINQTTADILCAEQKYDDALEYLEPTDLYTKSVADRIKRAEAHLDNRDHHQKKLLDVPFVRQNFYTCAPASLTSVSRYWGTEVSQEQVIEEICYRGTHQVDERHWAIKQGWIVKEFELQFNSAKQLLDNNIPILLTTVDAQMGHLQVLVGYDQSKGTYFVRDPSYPRLQELLIEAAETYYAASGPRCMIILPRHQQTLLNEIELPAAALYDAHFELKSSLENEDRTKAFQALRQLIDVDQNHRITLIGQKDIAYYDQDYRKIDQTLDELRKRYPDDTNLIIEKTYNLKNIGTSKQVLAYLEPFVEVPHCHHLLKNLYIEELRHDGRNLSLSLKLSNKLLKHYSLNDRVLITQANLLWDQKNHQESRELYRLASCLEDKNEQYAHQYHLASRFVKQETVALDFLEDRFKRFSKKSSGPGLSYYNAAKYSMGEEQALNILEQTITLHPNDGHLHIYTAQEYLLSGKLERSRELLTLAEPIANKIEFLQIQGFYYETNNEFEKALQCLEKVISYQPLNQSATQSVIRILEQLGREKQAKELVANLLAKFPSNYNLLTRKYRLTPESDASERMAQLEHIIDLHPSEYWPYLEYSVLLGEQNRLDDALNIAKKMTNVRPDIASGFTQSGKMEFQLGNTDSAKHWFEQAIKISCDETEAYDLLLQCADSQALEKQYIDFIKSELINQTSEGEGILGYQQFASPYETTEQLEEFLTYACRERPDLWQSWIAKSRNQRKLGMLDEAIDTLTQALERHGLKPIMYLELGKTYRVQGNLAQAEQETRRALEINPDWSSSINELSEILNLQGKTDEAIQALEKYLRINPQEVISHSYLASLYWSQEKHELAIGSLSKALELYPEYRWGWNEIASWNTELNQHQNTVELIQAARTKHPHSVPLVLVEASVYGTSEEATNVLKEFSKDHPNALNVFTEYCYLLCDLNEPEKAKHTLEQYHWNKSSVTDISTLRAYIEVELGYIDRGIDIIDSVVTAQPGFSSGWRYLTAWHAIHKRDVAATKRSLNHFVKLNSSNASEIYFGALKLQEVAPHDPLIKTLVEKCLRLDPTNESYLATYFNHLQSLPAKENNLSKEQLIASFDNALKLTAPIKKTITYTLYSLITECFKGDNIERIIALWSELLTTTGVQYYQLEKAWLALEEHGVAHSATETIEKLWLTNGNINVYAGEFLAKGKTKQLTLKQLDQWMISTDFTDAFSDGVIEEYIRHTIRIKSPLNKKVFNKLSEKIASNTMNWGLIGYYYADQSDWKRAGQWFEDYKSKSGVQAWQLYFYGITKLQLGNWRHGIEIMTDAFALPSDSYRDEIVTWMTLNGLLENQEMDLEEFNRINVKDLSSYSNYAHHLAQALILVESSSLEAEHNNVSTILRHCQRLYQPIVGQLSVTMAKAKAQRALKRKIESKHLKKLYWQWKLSNYF
ncbi:tetratricopeptide repeat protein [Sessilibacter corallicola]|uniref:Peptidase C39-like domain-containing protein n=1 Tax=Sessilibacter corallicola TaxID=2904075 RepID=A0ABQ0A5P8_9GAMM